MEKLLSALRHWDPRRAVKKNLRRYLTHLIAELQYAAGLRIAEVASLTEADVDPARALVYVRGGKHGSKRLAFLTEYAAEVLQLYLSQARPVLARVFSAGESEKLFFQDYAALTKAANRELARAAAEAGVRVITSHGFRHALGYHLLRAGCPLRYIQAILGHQHLADTEVYTKVDAADVKRVFDACHPRMR
jgi:site-specific recombinase XerD